ncbi:MAG TPA: hypothetical protein VH165_37220 [Kofleriaceae bacterium]|nr:hypothetical protein [Kofleriaceae bacterium]
MTGRAALRLAIAAAVALGPASLGAQPAPPPEPAAPATPPASVSPPVSPPSSAPSPASDHPDPRPGLPASMTTSEVLHEANAAAIAGDWSRVQALIDPLLAQRELAVAELTEAHRLAGIAGFFQQRRSAAEAHFVAYLRIDPEARLDPALYPPDVVAFFNDVASRHAAELHAQRASSRRTWLWTLLPPVGQLQNGHRTKAIVIGGLLGGLLATNLTTYAVLSKWCSETTGPAGGGLNCDNGPNHNHAASVLRPINIASGIGLVLVYAYGVYDGVRDYRQRSRELTFQPYVATSPDRNLFGVAARF